MIKTFERGLLIVLSIIMMVLVFFACWQVFFRYVVGKPSTFTVELLKYSMIWMSMIGASYVFAKREHLAFMMIRNKYAHKKRALLFFTIDLILFSFAFFVMTWGGIDLVLKTYHEITPALGLSMGLVYSVIPISGVIIILIKLFHLYEDITAIFRRRL
jgi:TRAP-type C4-dicarboxylate transport system permease small subunit